MDLSTRISNSWIAIKASSYVMRKEPMLFVFPFYSILITIGSFCLVLWLVMTNVLGVFNDFSIFCFGYLAMFIGIYLLANIMSVYNGVAIVGCARMRLDGKDPTVIDGFRIATLRLPSIILWGLVEATIGNFISSLKTGPWRIGGRWAYGMKMGWYVDTIFVLSIIAAANTGPMDALGRSRTLVTKKWGQNLAPNYNIWLTFVLIGLAIGALFFTLAIFGLVFGLGALIIYFLILFVLICLLLSLISSTVKCIFEAALFRYATVGEPGLGFSASFCEDAFVQVRGDMDWNKGGWTGDWQ